MAEWNDRLPDALAFVHKVSFLLALQLFRLGSRNRELDDFAATWDRSVQRIRQFESHFVRPRRQSHKNHRFRTGIDNWPGLVIDVVVQVSNPWRHLQGGFSEYR